MAALQREFSAPTLQLLTHEGELRPTPEAEQFLPVVEALADAELEQFYRDMTISRRIDVAGANLQRQGQLALWVPSHGQEAAQVGSARAARPQDHIFPSYREHIVGMIRGLDPVKILTLLRGATLGGWDPAENGNFHLYTLVLASQTLHATGYAMGLTFDGATATGHPETDAAVLVYYGDGATSQGDASEALVFASSYQTPQVFFVQNNQWAISVPVARQSRSPLALRGTGFGMPGLRIDGNDVLVSYAVSRVALEEARSGLGPSLIEAVTYRMGAHTTADDPTKYRTREEESYWAERDPITRYRTWLEGRGASAAFFDEVEQEAQDVAADLRRRALEAPAPAREKMFEHVYAETHPLMHDQYAWLDAFERGLDGGAA
ncbi:thiamine pyrophosphate-dependent dehydrogenase E1 component subunit alpha [Agromyces aerolatus]|uniref:thiamine pyrophosphate-dependent dehydrogenase E1 component subunit alpha n=1 Tax=Agromyces sp. LY-1074 TaxID=3074080 RepID=UPI002860CB82|nr:MULTISPECIES: thiamine pyrophosphate-dependent dehydrogenase E1 component subunit alpha [unclassified Agromyces]MDR5699349.1 thiamine pyrophosphate-dependent dehydrogenase E1 component subunit alpha [Agromyces sp. LY-1074]MDR5705645.1 thiamine pyrophosphate-dependent dehydrogenase E1 component subunit alpha [Agromyces sp. LY-1358]